MSEAEFLARLAVRWPEEEASPEQIESLCRLRDLLNWEPEEEPPTPSPQRDPKKGKRKRLRLPCTVHPYRLKLLNRTEEREDFEYTRPETRGECEKGIRPCPFVSCKYNLYLDVDFDSLRLNFPDLEPEEMIESCALDIADREPTPTLEVIGDATNLSRERIRQIETRAFALLRPRAERLDLADFVCKSPLHEQEDKGPGAKPDGLDDAGDDRGDRQPRDLESGPDDA